MGSRAKCVVCVAGLLMGAAAFAQDEVPGAPVASSAAELLEMLKAAGVEIPEGIVANEDGTVALPSAPGDVAADVPESVPAVAPAPTATISPSAAEGGADAVEAAPAATWDNLLTASLNYSDGNVEQTNARIGIVSTRESLRSKLTLDASAFYATDQGDESANEATLGALQDWKFQNSRWLAFGEGRYNYNEFDLFLHRLSFFFGPGYKAIDRDNMELVLRAGLGGRRDFGGEEDSNDIEFEALIGFDYTWDLSERQRTFVRHRTFPSLENGSDFRATTAAGWQIDMDDVLDGLSFNVGLEHEFQTPVPENIRKSDLRLFAGLGLSF